MTDQTKAASTMQKFRKVNRRFDFYPTTDSLDFLRAHPVAARRARATSTARDCGKRRMVCVGGTGRSVLDD